MSTSPSEYSISLCNVFGNCEIGDHGSFPLSRPRPQFCCASRTPSVNEHKKSQQNQKQRLPVDAMVATSPSAGNDAVDVDVGMNMECRKVAGYTAVRLQAHTGDKTTKHKAAVHSGQWLYLRKQGDNMLFIGNLPWPVWIPFSFGGGLSSSSTSVPSSSLSAAHTDQIQALVKQLVPGSATGAAEVFGIGNGQLAARVGISDKVSVDAILQKPSDHLYLDVLSHFSSPTYTPGRNGDNNTSATTITNNKKHNNKKNDFVSRLVDNHASARDAEAVRAWSDAAMKAFETREQLAERERQQHKTKASVPDDDGFVTVTDGAPQMKAGDLARTGQPLRLAQHDSQSGGSGGGGKRRNKKRRRGTVGSGGGLDVEVGGDGEGWTVGAQVLRTSRGIEKSGFYRWQRRNEGELGQLQTKFRQDQQRVAAIRGLGQHGHAAMEQEDEG